MRLRLLLGLLSLLLPGPAGPELSVVLSCHFGSSAVRPSLGDCSNPQLQEHSFAMARCSVDGCQREVATPRSQLCAKCFLERARTAGRRGGAAGIGRPKQLAGEASSGNTKRGRSKQLAGEASSGNTKRGRSKKLAGETSSGNTLLGRCLLYTSPSPRDRSLSRMPSSA